MMNKQKPCHKGILALNGVGYSFIKNKNIIWYSIKKEDTHIFATNIRVKDRFTVYEVIKNGKVVQNTKEKTGDLDNDTMEKINDIVINVFKK